ncbi:MAG: hypothetical protein ACI93R_002637 [Flavobacteriales bacterium]|jgi:hypothetical protein
MVMEDANGASLEQLEEANNLIRQFDFSVVGVQIQHADCLPTLAGKIKAI